jgi:DNA-binding CsgD family transcriptional regulator
VRPDSRVMRGTVLRAEPLRGNPTIYELETLIEVVNQGGYEKAAQALGVQRGTVRGSLSRLYHRIRTSDRIEAVRLLWPVIGDQLLPDLWPKDVAPGSIDRRSGRERRAV